MADFDRVEMYEGLIKKYYGSFLREIIVLPGRKSVEDVLWRRVLISRRNAKVIRRRFSKKDIGRVIIFNDKTVECQLAAYLASNNDIPMEYMEDGFAAYLMPSDQERNPLKDMLARSLFGRFYDNIKVIGTSPWVTTVRVFFPALVIPPLKGKPIVDIEKGVFGAIKKEFVDEFTSGIDDDLDMVIVLPHSDILSSLPMTDPAMNGASLRNEYLAIIKEASSLHKKIGIKYHPRETSDYLGDYDGCVVLPKHVPMELIYLIQKAGSVKKVVGTLSTSIYTARIIFGDNLEISVLDKGLSEGSAAFMRTLGIEVMERE